MQAILGDEIDPSPQEILEVHQQCAEGQARLANRQSHEQIDVPAFIHVAPRHGTEHARVAEAVGSPRAQISERWDSIKACMHHPPACVTLRAAVPEHGFHA